MNELARLKQKRDDLNRRIEQLEKLEPIQRDIQKALRDLADGFDTDRTRINAFNESQDRSRYAYNYEARVVVETKIELVHFDLGKVELSMEREMPRFR